MQNTKKFLSILFFACSWQCVIAFAAQQHRVTPIRVTVDPHDGSVWYKIANNPRAQIGSREISSELQSLSKSEDGSKIVFIISNNAPISELSNVLAVVDKYELAFVRFFICDFHAQVMVEIKRDEDGLFRWTNHSFALSENPPEK
jgi:hypothetical protein